jgi:rare lipoprotein A
VPTLIILCCATLLTVACSAVDVQTREDVRSDAAPTAPAVHETREGLASFVASALDGRKTASGELYDSAAMVAAHPTYPFATVVRVTNLENDRRVEVQVVDRGPVSAARKEGVIIDLSRTAAEALGFIESGRARVRLDVLRWGDQR